MSDYDYKTILAPTKPSKVKGVRDAAERMEQTLANAINAGCAGGWEFFGTETIQMETKGGLFSKPEQKAVTFLVFTRPKPMRDEPPASPADATLTTSDARLGPAT